VIYLFIYLLYHKTIEQKVFNTN